jgi:pimeloyl-ACP methyl ester carboxylesterase
MTFPIGFSSQGTGMPVVLLHSSMSSKTQWNRLASRLQSSYHVISIDLYGYGETGFPKNQAAFSLQAEVDLVHSLLATVIEDHTPFHLVGHSYGGAVALKLALEKKYRIASLLLYEPVSFHLLEKSDPAFIEIKQIVDQIETMAIEDTESATRLFIDYWNGAGAFHSLPETAQTALTAQIKKVQLDFQALITDSLRLSDLHTLDMPVCLVEGKKSPRSTKRIIDLSAAALPRSIRHEVRGGHMAPITHADEVNDIIVSSLKRAGGGF